MANQQNLEDLSFKSKIGHASLASSSSNILYYMVILLIWPVSALILFLLTSFSYNIYWNGQSGSAVGNSGIGKQGLTTIKNLMVGRGLP